jgi:hypothetical protein
VEARADGDQIEESAEFGELRLALERFLPAVLRESYPAQWRHEAFDGFRLAVARRTGPFEAELLGLGLLISDQTWTPMHVRLRAAADADSISWVLCRVGSRIGAGPEFTRLPHDSTKMSKLLYSVSEQPENIAWAFTVERGAEARSPTSCG